ncbi:hypothetical protein [Streptomyces nigrescens]|uniref:Tyr recombinase domain-containing protein n=1 Tax=Streptomyces nigrescens TaxID=1920 RepID=A0A640T8C4_STRNI|nr:hypothetical protein [Streptomyces libani]WAT94848.1 hypothetical protein STRLI_000519 [Streptomyces libani subsp. libani]GFE19993.1 hypothetical protein Sliba_04460 [Streptomyces libani subsp. libani]GGV85485.1 hypothetical protein GCM10010500_01990 [Streptomyces libani subsp. libani]
MRSAQFDSREAEARWAAGKVAAARTRRPPLTTALARAALAAISGDVELHAAATLMLLAGLRPGEVQRLRVLDWTPGREPRLTIRSDRRERTIRIAPSAASVLDALLEGENAELGEPLLLGLEHWVVHRLFRDAMQQAGLDVDVLDLRRAAMAAALEGGTPMQHMESYFGMSKTETRKDLVPVRDGYDVRIAAALEAEFAS